MTRKFKGESNMKNQDKTYNVFGLNKQLQDNGANPAKWLERNMLSYLAALETKTSKMEFRKALVNKGQQLSTDSCNTNRCDQDEKMLFNFALLLNAMCRNFKSPVAEERDYNINEKEYKDLIDNITEAEDLQKVSYRLFKYDMLTNGRIKRELDAPVENLNYVARLLGVTLMILNLSNNEALQLAILVVNGHLIRNNVLPILPDSQFIKVIKEVNLKQMPVRSLSDKDYTEVADKLEHEIFKTMGRSYETYLNEIDAPIGGVRVKSFGSK